MLKRGITKQALEAQASSLFDAKRQYTRSPFYCSRKLLHYLRG